MKDDPQNNKNEEIEIESEKGFFKKLWYSIQKLERYPELSAEGFNRAINYFIKLMIILSIVTTAMTVYLTSKDIKKIAKSIDKDAPNFTYNGEILTVETTEPIIQENEEFGKIIIDTNAENEEKINEYVKEVEQEENAVIILKDKLVLKQVGTVTYNYKDLFGQIGITEFNKQNLVEYMTSKNMMSIYVNLFITLLIYAFIIQFINTIMYAVTVSIFGYLTAVMLRLKIRYVAIFNMAIYSITLPVIFNIAYVIINGIFNFTITYFEVMYMLVATIYMIASIFMIKVDFNKKQEEIQKIIEVQKEVKEELKQQENEKEKDKETEKKKEKDDKKENKKEQDGEEPQGSNA